MAVYKSFEQMSEVLTTALEAVFADPSSGPKLKKTKLVVKYDVREPDGEVWLATGEGRVVCGPYDQKPNIEVSIDGNTLHDFLMRKIDITGLMLREDVSIKGPFSKFVKFVPLLNRAYEIYPGVAEKSGLPAS